MNKKIKIIEIFNIISNGEYEKLPLNIKVDGNKYNWDTLEHFYNRKVYNRKDSDREDLLELARKYDTITFLDMIAEVLDDSAEDNTEEIEELKPVKDGITYRYEWSEIPNKINELVKAVNKLRKENKK